MMGKNLLKSLTISVQVLDLGVICKNRPVNAKGFSHGGVAILFRESLCFFKIIFLPNPGDFEVVVASTKFPGHSNQVIVVGCYVPPTYDHTRGTAAMEYIRDVVPQLKVTYRSPYIIVSGDFNQRKVDEALQDLNDLHEADVGPTRASRQID